MRKNHLKCNQWAQRIFISYLCNVIVLMYIRHSITCIVTSLCMMKILFVFWLSLTLVCQFIAYVTTSLSQGWGGAFLIYPDHLGIAPPPLLNYLGVIWHQLFISKYVPQAILDDICSWSRQWSNKRFAFRYISIFQESSTTKLVEIVTWLCWLIELV